MGAEVGAGAAGLCGARVGGGWRAVAAAASLLLAWVGADARAAGPGPSATPAAEAERMQRIEDHMRALQEELATLKQAREVDAARVEQVEGELGTLQELFSRVKVGGYGSMRYEANDVRNEKNTFTLRRLVFTTEAQITDSMRFYSELEYERFRELELERTTEVTEGGLKLEQEVEGTAGSEIALEQAWFEYAVDPRLRLRAGGVLVPIGRFNINHDDNQWNLTRRTLVDRGVPVVPIPTAWDELGVGFNGNFQIGDGGNFGYQIYVVNGATIEGSLEEIAQTRDGRRDKLELEAKFTPQTGTFSNDVKEGKAVTGRFAFSPETGHEIAFSFYRGRYTPDYLAGEDVSAFALDGITRFAGFELEGEVVTSHWSGIEDVAESFAERALRSESNNPSAFDPNLEGEIEFELANLAKQKTGYWLELRYPFWPTSLPTFGFSSPQLIPVGRFEQVWFNDLLQELAFTNGAVTDLETRDARLSRATLGLAFRPTPLVVFSAAYEYTWAHRGSLAGLTNYLAASEDEGHANAFTMGVSFGF